MEPNTSHEKPSTDNLAIIHTRHFSFGDNHMYGLGTYVTIKSTKLSRCRDIMFQLFGTKWCGEYDDAALTESINKWQWNRAVTVHDTELGLVIQQHKNIAHDDIPSRTYSR